MVQAWSMMSTALSGRAPVGDVAHAELDGGDQRLVEDAHAVELLVVVFEAAQDGERVVVGRFADVHRLEAALEGRVLLDVTAILVVGGRADAAQRATREGGLEDVGRVERIAGAGRPGADERVDLVDEEDGLFVGGGLFDELRETLLELAAVHGPGEQHPHLDRADVPAGDDRGDVAARDELRQALDDRRLADAGVADEDGVGLVLGHEDLDDLEDLRLASDDRLQLAPSRELREVAPELLQHAGRGLGPGLLHGAALAVGVG